MMGARPIETFHTNFPPKTVILRWPDVQARVGLSKSQVYSLVGQTGPDGRPLFPRPIKLGLKASGWIESEIEEWIREKILAARPSSFVGGEANV